MSNRFGPAVTRDCRRQQWPAHLAAPLIARRATDPALATDGPRGCGIAHAPMVTVKHRGVDGCACPVLRRWCTIAFGRERTPSLLPARVFALCSGDAGRSSTRLDGGDRTACHCAREPHSDLCVGHAGRITTPRGWGIKHAAAAQPP